MRNRMISVVLVMSCLIAGCTLKGNKEVGRVIEEKDFQLEVQSSVEQKDCFICGDYSYGLMSYYEKKDSIGIIHWNSGTIMDTEVRIYDDTGNEVFRQDSNMKLNNLGNKDGTVMVNPMPVRGISEAVINYKNEDELNFNLLKQKLCQDCLDRVVTFYVDQKNLGKDSHIATTGYCLVDFQTKQLHTLSEPYRMYFIRDYHVSYDIKEDSGGAGDRIEIQIFYAPERRFS